MPLRRIPHDATLSAAWWRFVRLWRPMAIWTVIVFGLIGLVLAPLLSSLLRSLVLRGDRAIVGNVELLWWALDPLGALYLVSAGSIAIVGGVVRYAGIFRIITDDMEGERVSTRQTLFELLPDLPALLKLCVSTVILAALLAAPLLLGVGATYLIWLGEYDINYYLSEQPAEWRRALLAAGAWTIAWAAGALYLTLRSLPALPAYLDGHRPLRIAIIESWARTRGDADRALGLLLFCLIAWLTIRAAAQALYLLTASGIITAISAASSSVIPVLLATATWAAGSLALDGVLSFVGFSFTATVLTKFYLEDTDLHRLAPPIRIGLAALPRRVGALLLTWLRPQRALPVLAALLLLSAAFSSWLLGEGMDDAGFTVTAHRAGALTATENTLEALEHTIESGADYAEIDVQRTLDGVVVVIHDADLMRLAGDPRTVTRTPYDQLRDLELGRSDQSPVELRRLATLDEFLARSRGRINLMIELKYYAPDPTLAPAVVNVLKDYEMEDDVVIVSLELAPLQEVRRLSPEIRTGYLASVSVGDLTRLPVDLLGISRSLASNRLLRVARREGIEVHVWTLNQTAQMLDVVQRGADGVITDDPYLAVQLRNELTSLTAGERLLLRLRDLLPDLEGVRSMAGSQD